MLTREERKQKLSEYGRKGGGSEMEAISCLPPRSELS